jgi:hypothetical protein
MLTPLGDRTPDTGIMARSGVTICQRLKPRMLSLCTTDTGPETFGATRIVQFPFSRIDPPACDYETCGAMFRGIGHSQNPTNLVLNVLCVLLEGKG